MTDILIYTILGLIALAGVVLTIFSLPGIWLVYLSVVILAIYKGFEVISISTLVSLFIISVASTIVDNFVVGYGAKKYGASTYGIVGGILGGIIGLMVGNIVGMFIGPMIGAVTFEMIFQGKDLNQSIKSGIGATIGIFLSILLKIGINIGIIVFVISKLI